MRKAHRANRAALSQPSGNDPFRKEQGFLPPQNQEK